MATLCTLPRRRCSLSAVPSHRVSTDSESLSALTPTSSSDACEPLTPKCLLHAVPAASYAYSQPFCMLNESAANVAVPACNVAEGTVI